MNGIIPVTVGKLLGAETEGPSRTHFLEFFTANIRNPNTRRAYARASMDFLGWCSEQGVTALPTNHPISAYQV